MKDGKTLKLNVLALNALVLNSCAEKKLISLKRMNYQLVVEESRSECGRSSSRSNVENVGTGKTT